MLADALKYLAGLATGAKDTQVVSVPGLPKKVFVRHGDALTPHDVPPSDRNHTVETLQSLIDMALDTVLSPNPLVFVSAAGIVLLFDRGDRRERATLCPSVSERFALLRDLEKGGWQGSPKDAIELLRDDFHGGNTDVIAALRQLEFVTTDVTGSTQKRGDERMSRVSEAKVNSPETVPSSFYVVVPVWSTPGMSHWTGSVRINLEFDIENAQVTFTPLSDECRRVQDATLKAAHDELREKLAGRALVFLGKP